MNRLNEGSNAKLSDKPRLTGFLNSLISSRTSPLKSQMEKENLGAKENWNRINKKSEFFQFSSIFNSKSRDKLNN